MSCSRCERMNEIGVLGPFIPYFSPCCLISWGLKGIARCVTAWSDAYARARRSAHSRGRYPTTRAKQIASFKVNCLAHLLLATSGTVDRNQIERQIHPPLVGARTSRCGYR